MALKFAVCVNKSGLGDFSGDDLTIGHVYEVVGEERRRTRVLRIIDQSGEDYLYPASCFESVNMSESAAHRLHDALGRR